MTNFSRGQKGKLAEMGCSGKFPVSLTLESQGMDIDISCFGLDVSGQLSDDRFMVFFNQKSCPGEGVMLELGNGSAIFTIDVLRLPEMIHKLVVTASINGEGTMRKLGTSTLRLGTATFSFSGADFQDEKAVIVGEIYKRDDLWRFGAVGQGFNGGLSSLLKHFGGTEAAPAPAPAPSPINLNKISLTKKGESSRISLNKGKNDRIRIKAIWIDNGDSRSDNDDLDLRAGILLPDGKMHWLAASHPGSLIAAPFARHLGDVRQATKNAPGTEIIEVNPEISKRLGGPVGLVFSVYSAISNGPVSIASLKPVMFIENGENVVECRYDFPDGEVAKNVYTYVIGTLVIDSDTVTVRLSGLTSKPCSENTPWILRKAETLEVSFEGVPVFKSGRNMFVRMLGVGSKKYVNV